MKAILPLVLLFSVILIANNPLDSFASSSHPFITQWGESGLTAPGKFQNPQNIAIDSSGNVYVTDLGNKRVQKFDNNGTFLLAWGSSGTGSGQFHAPAGITVYDNHVFVVDSQLNKVQKFDNEGNFVSQWGIPGQDPGKFMLPNGITIGENATVYVVDTGNHRVQQFTTDGEFLSEFGESGSGDHQFISPMEITIDSSGTIYVSDAGSQSIKKFDADGNFVKNINYNVGGIPIRAQGLESDTLGNFYVADTGNDRILRLDSEGTALSVWGSMGTLPGQFKMPKDVALDQNGDLFVVDSNGHRIQKFGTPIVIDTPQDSTPEQSTSTQASSTQTPTQQNSVPASQLPPPNPIPGDLTKPSITPPNDLIIEATGALTPVNVGQAIATDASGIQSLTNNAPDQFTLGINTVIWTAIDGAGNMAIATQDVTISDTIPPTMTSPGDVSVEAENPTKNYISLEQPIVSDTVGVMTISSDAPEFFPLGETIVTWTANDIVGNSATITQRVNVIDTTSPDLYAPENVVIEATSFDQNDVFLGEATVIDNGEILSVTNDAPVLFGLGNTTVTWLASDSSGNTQSAQQLVSVIDTTSPQVDTPQEIIFEATSKDSNEIQLTNPAASDIQEILISSDAPALFPIGETVVTWVIEDLSGNTATTTQHVKVVDTTIPTITVPEDVSIEATGLTGNNVNLGDVIVDDVSGIVSITNDSPDSFPFGVTAVTWTAEDSYGNIATAVQTISVVDTTAPTVIAPSDMQIEASSIDQNYVELGQPTVDDLVDIESVSNDSPQSYSIGMTTVTWTVTDTSGNTSTDSQVITISDTTLPEIVSPEDLVIEADNPLGMKVNIGEAGASDAIGIDNLSSDAPELFQLGETTVTWTATDLHGNSASSTQSITVVDTAAPEITAPQNVEVEATSSDSNLVEIGIAEASDLVGIDSLNNDAPEIFPVGDTIITWTATDASGNSATATQTVSVIDSSSPVITPPEDITIEAISSTENIVELTQVDAQDEIGVVSITNDAPAMFPVGDTIVTWTATDASGNSATATQTVSVIDTTAPRLYVPDSVTAEAVNQFENVIEYGVATATDEVGVTSITNDAPISFPLGLTPITWTATDDAGNEYSAIQQVLVEDTTAPEIIPPENITIEATSADTNSVVLGEAIATDAVLVDSITNDAPQVFSLGETVVSWTATDSSGNSETVSQIVNVVDTTAPTITAPEDIQIEAVSLNSNSVSLGLPESEDSVSTVVITNDSPATFALGETIVTWTAVDQDGNLASDTQLVTIVDTTAPTIEIPDDVTVEATGVSGNILAIGDASASDLVEVVSITNDSIESFDYGDTTVTWTATDSSGNKVSKTQTITVIDTTAPVIIPPSNVSIEASGTDGNIVEIGTPSASDLIEVVSIESDAPATFSLGDTIVTWTATDASGNSATATQTISVIDTTAPELIIPDDVMIDATSLQTLVSIGSATSADLIDGAPVIFNDAPESFELGLTTITWTTQDIFGNSASMTQTVTVQACGKDIDYYNQIIGTPEDDIIAGTSQPDLIFALSGDDIINGDKGSDCIFGGEGDDILFGNEGSDNLTGDQGNDIIKGQSGNDIISGNEGVDVIDGGDDIDSCNVIPDNDGDLVVKCE